MGAWRFLREQFLDGVVRDPGRRVPRYVGRAESAAPAPGSQKVHVKEQEELVRQALEAPRSAPVSTPAASGPGRAAS
jgi:2-oxoglutarate dehydrogenase complex dehydrogenase (E1) component-like enzyme